MTIRGKFISMVLAVVMVVLVMVGVTYFRSKEVLSRNIHDFGREQVEKATQILQNYATIAGNIVEDSNSLIQLTWSNEATRNFETIVKAMEVMTTQNKKNGVVTVYFSFESNGDTALGAGGPLPEGLDARKRPWYQKAKEAGGRLVICDAYRDTLTDKLVYTLARSVTDSEGNFIGVVAADVDLESIGN
ncbi:MAG: hypothetical protein CSA35_09610, partial [Dethiosulfovibrio peptidovorans]